MTRPSKIFFVLPMFIWGMLFLNGWAGPFRGHIMFENLRLQGVKLLSWLMIPWICLLMLFFRCRTFPWLVLPMLLVPVFGLIKFLSFDDAMELIRTGKDRTMPGLLLVSGATKVHQD